MKPSQCSDVCNAVRRVDVVGAGDRRQVAHQPMDGQSNQGGLHQPRHFATLKGGLSAVATKLLVPDVARIGWSAEA